MVNFINTAPVYMPWIESGGHPGWEVIEGTPTELNTLLRSGMLEAGLVSSYAYGIDNERYVLLPDLGISACGAVGSVLLFSRTEIDRLDGQVVGLTPQSATSINLLRIIFEKFLGIQPRYRSGCFMELEQGDAAAYLSIGDEALRRRSAASDYHIYDLARIWLEHTSLPFVFAVCAVRAAVWRSDPDGVRSLGETLSACRYRGRGDLERISRMVAPRIPMTANECLEYLSGIEFDLSSGKQQGLLTFFRELESLGGFPHIDRLNIIT